MHILQYARCTSFIADHVCQCGPILANFFQLYRTETRSKIIVRLVARLYDARSFLFQLIVSLISSNVAAPRRVVSTKSFVYNFTTR